MNTTNTGTSPASTGHSRPSERKFANKLFIGLIVLVLAAFAISFVVGQKRDLRPAGVETAPSETNSVTAPEPPQNQQAAPKN